MSVCLLYCHREIGSTVSAATLLRQLNSFIKLIDLDLRPLHLLEQTDDKEEDLSILHFLSAPAAAESFPTGSRVASVLCDGARMSRQVTSKHSKQSNFYRANVILFAFFP